MKKLIIILMFVFASMANAESYKIIGNGFELFSFDQGIYRVFNENTMAIEWPYANDFVFGNDSIQFEEQESLSDVRPTFHIYRPCKSFQNKIESKLDYIGDGTFEATIKFKEKILFRKCFFLNSLSKHGSDIIDDIELNRDRAEEWIDKMVKYFQNVDYLD